MSTSLECVTLSMTSRLPEGQRVYNSLDGPDMGIACRIRTSRVAVNVPCSRLCCKRHLDSDLFLESGSCT